MHSIIQVIVLKAVKLVSLIYSIYHTLNEAIIYISDYILTRLQCARPIRHVRCNLQIFVAMVAVVPACLRRVAFVE